MEENGYSRAECLEALRAHNWDIDAALDQLEGNGAEEGDSESGSNEYSDEVKYISTGGG